MADVRDIVIKFLGNYGLYILAAWLITIQILMSIYGKP